MVKHMGKCYGFGPLRRWKGGSLSDDGTLVFPGDTAKKPLLTMENSLGTVFMYKWGVVALPMRAARSPGESTTALNFALKTRPRIMLNNIFDAIVMAVLIGMTVAILWL